MDSSFPPSEPGAYRSLGSSAGPVRVPLVIALVALLLLVAIPLYLWRRPHGGLQLADAPVAQVLTATPLLAAGNMAMPAADDGSSRRVSLSEVKMARCYVGKMGRLPSERCDRLPTIEESLTRAIRESSSCAPPLTSGGLLSFVLTVDFLHKKTHLWAGRSGTLHKPKARDLLRCVERAIPTLDFAMPHQFDRYDVNVLATYPPTGTLLPAVGMSGAAAPANVVAAPGVVANFAAPVPAAPANVALPGTAALPTPQALPGAQPLPAAQPVAPAQPAANAPP